MQLGYARTVNVLLAPAETVRIGDAVTLDAATGRYRRAVAGRYRRAFNVPPGSHLDAATGALVMPEPGFTVARAVDKLK